MTGRLNKWILSESSFGLCHASSSSDSSSIPTSRKLNISSVPVSQELYFKPSSSTEVIMEMSFQWWGFVVIFWESECEGDGKLDVVHLLWDDETNLWLILNIKQNNTVWRCWEKTISPWMTIPGKVAICGNGMREPWEEIFVRRNGLLWYWPGLLGKAKHEKDDSREVLDSFPTSLWWRIFCVIRTNSIETGGSI